jgi:hypothetical protein
MILASAMQDLQIEPKCLGSVHGVVGKIRFLPGLKILLEMFTIINPN